MVVMPTITLKNIPPDLHERLKTRAQQRGRSLNSEVLHILSDALEPRTFDVEAFLATVREHRDGLPGPLTDDLLMEALDRRRR